jgi:hypothetical protein
MWESNNVLWNNNCFRECCCALQRGDVLVILKQAENNYLECQRGEGTGRVHPSQMKIVTPLDERPRGRPNVRNCYREGLCPAWWPCHRAINYILHSLSSSYQQRYFSQGGDITSSLLQLWNKWLSSCWHRLGVPPSSSPWWLGELGHSTLRLSTEKATYSFK